ncbi:MAG: hypothetical protein J6M24_04160 [Lachnospiraceae bacterium]|nr:hypothetical protein [Lachnospiraceae bacterium]
MSENPNKENKDRLFKFIFGREENKAWTLSLYNAINGSSYEDPEAININTIDDVMYLGMKNDVSFIISETMNIYEQQSSYNPNMPMRQLIYAGKMFSKHIEDAKINVYSSALKKFPTPKLVCFYNGEFERPEREILNLTDAFLKSDDSDISAKVTMININYGKNQELMSACQALKEYSWLVEEIRKNRKEKGLDKAIEKAILNLDEKALLKPFLMGHLAEVKNMCLREYSEEEIKEMFREDGIEEGFEQGMEQGLEQGLAEATKRYVVLLLNKGKTTEEIHDLLDIPLEEVIRIANEYK